MYVISSAIHASTRTKLCDRRFLALVHTALQRPSFDVNHQRPNSRRSNMSLQSNSERTAKDNAQMSCQIPKEEKVTKSYIHHQRNNQD